MPLPGVTRGTGDATTTCTRAATGPTTASRSIPLRPSSSSPRGTSPIPTQRGARVGATVTSRLPDQRHLDFRTIKGVPPLSYEHENALPDRLLCPPSPPLPCALFQVLCVGHAPPVRRPGHWRAFGPRPVPLRDQPAGAGAQPARGGIQSDKEDKRLEG